MVNPIEILLVEDSPTDAKLTIRSLQKSNIANRITHMIDGAIALDYLFCEGIYKDRDHATDPRVVLLDIKLPKVNGIEVLRRIRSDPRTESLLVVILTSSEEQSDVARGYKLHANSYIVKPVDFQQFANAIKSLDLYWLTLNTPPAGTKAVESTVNDPSLVKA